MLLALSRPGPVPGAGPLTPHSGPFECPLLAYSATSIFCGVVAGDRLDRDRSGLAHLAFALNVFA